MPAPAIAAAGIGAVGSIFGGLMGGKGAKKAAKYQYKAAKKAIAEQKRQYDLTRADYAPYREAGYGGLAGYGDLVGVNGVEKQASAMDALRDSPFYQSLFRSGEEAILQNAAATGGIRGGNTQRSLADFGEDVFARTIDRQLGYLGGLSSMGLGATGQVANFGADKANNVSSLLQQQGAAQAGSALAQTGIWQGVINNLGRSIATALGPSSGGINSSYQAAQSGFSSPYSFYEGIGSYGGF